MARCAASLTSPSGTSTPRTLIAHRGNLSQVAEALALPLDVPPAVLDAAVRAANLIGDGLYGVDIKEIDGHAYVIEVNDNPSIDAASEDQRLGDALYRAVMADIRRRLDERRRVRAP